MRLGAAGWPGPYVVLGQASCGATWECSARFTLSLCFTYHISSVITLIVLYNIANTYAYICIYIYTHIYIYISYICIYFSTFLLLPGFWTQLFSGGQAFTALKRWDAGGNDGSFTFFCFFKDFWSLFLDGLCTGGSVCSLSKSAAATTFLACSQFLCKAKVTLTQPVEVDEVDAEIVVVEGGSALKLPCQNIFQRVALCHRIWTYSNSFYHFINQIPTMKTMCFLWKDTLLQMVATGDFFMTFSSHDRGFIALAVSHRFESFTAFSTWPCWQILAGCALGFVAPGQPPHVLHVDPGQPVGCPECDSFNSCDMFVLNPHWYAIQTGDGRIFEVMMTKYGLRHIEKVIRKTWGQVWRSERWLAP